MKLLNARVAGIAAILVGLSVAQAAQAGNGRSALSTLPKDTAMVVSIDVARARKSGLFNEAIAMAKKNPDTAKGIDLLKATAGFDVTRDLKTIVVGLAKDFQQSEKAVIILEGRFNAKKFAAFVKATGKSVSKATHAGISYFVTVDAEMALIKKSLVITPSGGMKAVINTSKGKAASVKKNREFMAFFKGADTSKDVWFVGAIPQALRSQIGMTLGGNTVNGVTASIDIQKGLSTKLRLTASSGAGAQSLVGLMKMGLQQAGNDASLKALGLAGMLSTVSVKATGAKVDIGFKLTDAELAKIKNLLKSFL